MLKISLSYIVGLIGYLILCVLSLLICALLSFCSFDILTGIFLLPVIVLIYFTVYSSVTIFSIIYGMFLLIIESLINFINSKFNNKIQKVILCTIISAFILTVCLLRIFELLPITKNNFLVVCPVIYSVLLLFLFNKCKFKDSVKKCIAVISLFLFCILSIGCVMWLSKLIS